MQGRKEWKGFPDKSEKNINSKHKYEKEQRIRHKYINILDGKMKMIEEQK